MKQLIENGQTRAIASYFEKTSDGWIGDGVIYSKTVVGSSCTVADYEPTPFIYPIQAPDEITMRQARLVLLGAGMLGAVESAIAALPEPVKSAAKIEWEYSQVVKRKNGFVEQLAPVIGWSEKQVDDLFIAGSKL